MGASALVCAAGLWQTQVLVKGKVRGFETILSWQARVEVLLVVLRSFYAKAWKH